MSNKREPLLSDWDITEYGLDFTPEVRKGSVIGAFAVREVYEAARAKDAELIQRLVDALYVSPGVTIQHTGVCSDQQCGCEEAIDINTARKVLADAKAAGFKPSDE